MGAKLSRKGSSVEGYWNPRNGDSEHRKIKKRGSPVWTAIQDFFDLPLPLTKLSSQASGSVVQGLKKRDLTGWLG